MLHADTAAPTCTGQGDTAVEGDTAGGSCMGQENAAEKELCPHTYPGQEDSLGDAGDCDWELEGVLAR